MAPPSNIGKVLITGCNGFTGKHLTAQLRAQNYQVYGICSKASNSPDVYKADITDIADIRSVLENMQPDFVIHLAAVTNVANQDNETFYRVNLLGTLNLLTALHEAHVSPQKIIIASSANVYGNSPVACLAETIYPKPVNHYGNSKLAMENMVSTWFDQFPIIVTRPFNYTGVGQDPDFVIPKIVAHYRAKNTEINLGNIAVVRDLSDVNFVVQSYIQLMQSNSHSEIFNICSGVGYSIKDILQLMQEIAGYAIQVKSNPDFFRRNEIKQLIGDNSKLFACIGKIPIIPLQETLKKMYTHKVTIRPFSVNNLDLNAFAK